MRTLQKINETKPMLVRFSLAIFFLMYALSSFGIIATPKVIMAVLALIAAIGLIVGYPYRDIL